ncbi:MAG: P-II family nitrogen regulator [Treponema sp.]|jgi:nitrogen regulatory protein PII 2|nr:P-II family nitrogen regulator [Treponema sp.]
MKEIIAVIRPKMMGKTKDALEKLGLPSMTAEAVLGRGKQRGIAGEVDIEYRPDVLNEGAHRGMKYIPKRQLSLAVKDSDVDKVIQTIIGINQSGQIGDGKIFVCPLDDALRVRTKESGDAALV